MGINYVKRPPRQEFDSPDDFISVALGETDFTFAAHDEELILKYTDKILDNIEEMYKNRRFYD